MTVPLDWWAPGDVLATVVNVEISGVLGRTQSNSEALLSLAARPLASR